MKVKSEINFSLNEFVSARCLPQTSVMRKQQRGNEVSYEYYNVKGKDSSRHCCSG